MESILNQGYMFNSLITVCSPGENKSKYRLIDGGHRWTAMLQLMNSEKNNIREKFQNLKICCCVLPYLPHSYEMAIGFGSFYYYFYC